jgi:hypothetical protein
MRIIQTKGKLQNGQLILDKSFQDLSITNQDVEVVIVVNNEIKTNEFQQARTEMQAAFKAAGIETDEQILNLIKEVKLELLEERQF